MRGYFAIGFVCVFVLAGVVAAQDTVLAVKPYGFILGNAQFNNNVKADIPTVAGLTDSVSNTLMTARQTRFGLTMGVEQSGWKLGGKVELDFWGLRGSGKNGAAMQSAPRLRLAYFQMTRNKVTLVFGQDWVVFAPLSPESDAHVSIPALSSSGNLWNRMPQFRLEYKSVTDAMTVLAQVALARPLASDQDPTGGYSQADMLGAGEVGKLPFLQGRLAVSPNSTATFGVSGHFGQEDFEVALNDEDISDKTSTYGFAADVKIGLPNVTFMAEGFYGANLITYFSNSSWFREPTGTEDQYKFEPIKAMGGWGSVGFKVPTSPVMFNLGAGIEILDEEQIDTIAVRDPGKAKLEKNFTIFGNILYSPVSRVRLGMEVGYIKTSYKTYFCEEEVEEWCKDDGDNVSVNLSAKFSF